MAAWFDRLEAMAGRPGAEEMLLLGGLLLTVIVALLIAIGMVRRQRPIGFEDPTKLAYQAVIASRLPDRKKVKRTVAKLRRYDPVRLKTVKVPGQDRIEVTVSARGVILGHFDRVSSDWLESQQASGVRIKAVFWDPMVGTAAGPICVIAVRLSGARSGAPRQPT